MKLRILVLLILTGFTVQAQVRIVKLDKTDIPKSITYKGHVIDAARYSANDGEHITFTTETGVVNSKGIDNEGSREAALYAYDYKLIDLKYILNRPPLYDFVAPCGLDVTAKYLPNTFAITDLNKDGTAEIWLMYKTACTGDVSPAILKVIMYEGTRKYAMRGETRIKLPGAAPYGGTYVFDAAFKTASAAFRTYATELWNKNVLEKFGK
jgi:hypothetical protein